MKAPSFWYHKKGAKALLLSPLGQMYRTGAMLRRAVTKPYKASVPIICIGNIVAGGAGKTPSCLALKKLLTKQFPSEKIVFVSRGYGGSEKGPLRVDIGRHSARQVGDEAILLARAAPCWIGRERAEVIRAAEKEASLIIMDDGLQNPKVAADVNLLVIDGAVGLGNKQLIPGGPLRETLNDAFSRIDAIIMVGKDETYLTANLGKPVFETKIVTSLPATFLHSPRVLAFAGIGRPQKFYDSCRNAGLSVMMTRDFPDHYAYSATDLQELVDTASRNDLKLITTTKDYVRVPETFQKKVSVLYIDYVFENGADLTNLILAKLREENP